MVKRLLLPAVAVCGLLTLASCGHDQTLQSIAVTPQNSTITTAYSGQPVNLQFSAMGTYIHPPETKDITSQVVWKSATPQVVDFVDKSHPGLMTTLGGCGTNLQISATMYSNPADPPKGSATTGSAGVNVQIVDVQGCD